MRCPSCGAIAQQGSLPCSECGAIQERDLAGNGELSQTDPVEESTQANSNQQAKPARSLIEFPGVTKHSLPQWRKELGERVREVQEKRAREALLETGGADAVVCGHETRAHQLELLPRAEAPPVNPIVAAALQRIERAHIQSRYAGKAAVATMLAYDEQPEYGLEVPATIEDRSTVSFQAEVENTPTRPERTHNLAVVPPQLISDPAASVVQAATIPVVAETEDAKAPEPALKPKRLILGDLNDPALNYLDSIPVAVCIDVTERRSAPVFFRMISGILDLIVVGLLSAPVVALVKVTDLKWEDPRAIGFAVGTFIVIGFLYLTVSIAFTGRTLGLKLLSLRVVDSRTGLIPTGGQSAARALVYMLSLAAAGIALIYTLINPDRHAPHDRLTRTAVVRV